MRSRLWPRPNDPAQQYGYAGAQNNASRALRGHKIPVLRGLTRSYVAAKYLYCNAVSGLLLRLKKAGVLPWTFIPDDHDVSHLPAWAKSPKQTTDGHLAEFARAHEAILATLDEKIPGAYLIPQKT